MTRIKIRRDDLHRPRGNYTVLDLPGFELVDDRNERYISAVSAELTRLLPAKGLILVVGLGNAQITADSLGPRVVNKIYVTKHLSDEHQRIGIPLREVAAFVPGVMAKTGIPTAETLAGIIKRLSPTAVILVDSLYTGEPSRLGRTVQISDVGLTPQGAEALTKQTLGCTTIALGVPTLMQLRHGDGDLIVTPRLLDEVMRRSANVLALAINHAAQRSLTSAEINYLVS